MFNLNDSDEEEDAADAAPAAAITSSATTEGAELEELVPAVYQAVSEEFYEMMASWRQEPDWILADCRRVYDLRRAQSDSLESDALAALPTTALATLQPESFVSSGFISQ